MSLHSYLSEQRAKNEYDAIRQEVVAEPAAGETQEVMPVSPSCKNRYNLLMIIPYFSAFVFTKELFFDIFKV